MKIEANIIFLHQAGQVTAFFDSVEQAKNVFNDFSEQLAKVREHENRWNVVFNFTALGARYSLDLRKCASAVMEIADELGPVSVVATVDKAKRLQAIKMTAREEGCGEAIEDLLKIKNIE